MFGVALSAILIGSAFAFRKVNSMFTPPGLPYGRALSAGPLNLPALSRTVHFSRLHKVPLARIGLLAPLLTLILFLALWSPARAQMEPESVPSPDQATPASLTDFSAEMTSREAHLITYVNEKRRAAGVAPLRWNRELSEGARWFAKDVVDSGLNCVHTDSQKRGPGMRLRAFGYSQLAKYGELTVCGFTEPRSAVAAWMGKAQQSEVLLDPDLREAGAGYYYSSTLQRGYIVLDLSVDPSFGPAILNDEAVETASPQVTLTVYDQTSTPVAMKVSNTPSFEGIRWEPFVGERSWTLEAGEGWRWVYVLLRDSGGRTSLLSDAIYLGAAAPLGEISLDQATNIGQGFTLKGMPTLADARVRFSLGWTVDDSDANFTVLQGPALAVDDSQAVGGTAMRMINSGEEGYAYATMSDLPTDRILTAYVRLKSPVAGGSDPIADLHVIANGDIVGAVTLRASNFNAANTWQEFPLEFAFGANPSGNQLQVEIVRDGDYDLTVDTVRIYGRALSLSDAALWSTTSYYRSRGVVGRWETSSGISEPFDVAFATADAASLTYGGTPALVPDSGEISFESNAGVLSAFSQTVFVCKPGCGGIQWKPIVSASWLQVLEANDGLILIPHPEGLSRGPYRAMVTLKPTSAPAGLKVSEASFLVTLRVNYPLPTNPGDDGGSTPGDSSVYKHIFLPTARR